MNKKIYFRVVRLNPDRREYQQQTIELNPTEQLLVEVDAELLDIHIVESLSHNIISVEELKRISDIFENAFSGEVRKVNNTPKWEDVGETSSNEDGWPTINGD